MSTIPEILFRGTTEEELEFLVVNDVYGARSKRNKCVDLIKRFTVNPIYALSNALEYSNIYSSEPMILILLNPMEYNPVQDKISHDCFYIDIFYIDIARNPIHLRDPDVKVLDRNNIEDIALYCSKDSFDNFKKETAKATPAEASLHPGYNEIIRV